MHNYRNLPVLLALLLSLLTACGEEPTTNTSGAPPAEESERDIDLQAHLRRFPKMDENNQFVEIARFEDITAETREISTHDQRKHPLIPSTEVEALYDWEPRSATSGDYSVFALGQLPPTPKDNNTYMLLGRYIAVETGWEISVHIAGFSPTGERVLLHEICSEMRGAKTPEYNSIRLGHKQGSIYDIIPGELLWEAELGQFYDRDASVPNEPARITKTYIKYGQHAGGKLFKRYKERIDTIQKEAFFAIANSCEEPEPPALYDLSRMKADLKLERNGEYTKLERYGRYMARMDGKDLPLNILDPKRVRMVLGMQMNPDHMVWYPLFRFQQNAYEGLVTVYFDTKADTRNAVLSVFERESKLRTATERIARFEINGQPILLRLTPDNDIDVVTVLAAAAAMGGGKSEIRRFRISENGMIDDTVIADDSSDEKEPVN